MFLKNAGLLRSRALSKALCDAGQVSRNDKTLQPSDTVRIGDLLSLHFATRTLDIEILDIPSGNVSRAKREDLYQIKREQRHDIHDIVNSASTTSSTRCSDDDDEDGLSGPLF